MNASVSLNPYPAYNSFIPQVNPARTGNGRSGDDVKYIVTTKILVLALSVLLAVVFFVVCLHIYAKWIWNTSPTRRGSPSFSSFWPRRRRNRSSSPTDDSSIVLDADAMANIHTITGLDKSAVEALPKFKYTTTDHLKSTDHLECAICLGKFEEDEMGRALPMCHHSFHLDCIDMWLYSHSTCPLCRAILEPIPSSPPTTSPSPSTSSSSSTPPHSPSITPRQEFHNMTNLDELEESEHQEQESANKRADSIPANILFWGNQASALSPVRIINNNSNSNSPRAATPSSQVVIDIVDSVDHVVESDHRRRDHHSSSPVASRSVQASLHRLLGRGRPGAMTSTTVDDGEEMMRVRPFRPSVSPSPSTAAPSRVSLSVSSDS